VSKAVKTTGARTMQQMGRSQSTESKMSQKIQPKMDVAKTCDTNEVHILIYRISDRCDLVQ